MSGLDETYKEYVRMHEILSAGIAPHKIIDPPALGTLEGKDIGVIARDFSAALNNYYDTISNDRIVLSETRGLSGTKNETLREILVKLREMTRNIVVLVEETVDAHIRSHRDIEVTDEIIKDILSKDIVNGGFIDKVSMYRLRRANVTKEMRDNIYDYIYDQKVLLFGERKDSGALLFPMNRFDIVAGGNFIVSTKDKIVKDINNVIIIYRNSPGYCFRNPEPKKEDVTVPMNIDYINRMKVLVRVDDDNDSPADDKSFIRVNKKGEPFKIYETFDYKTFIPMYYQGNTNICYRRAISYYCANTGIAHPDAYPVNTFTHVCNEIFEKNYYRHDLTILAKEYKFGKGLQDILKIKIKEQLIDAVGEGVPPKEIVISEVIRKAVNSAINGHGYSRESAISSYLGIIRLTNEFSAEYALAIGEVNWNSYPKIAMTDVFNRCVAKCDKANVWGIDFRSPKDLFWK